MTPCPLCQQPLVPARVPGPTPGAFTWRLICLLHGQEEHRAQVRLTRFAPTPWEETHSRVEK